jgi:N,N'-diacetyllegionaminate synthase
MVTAVDFGGRLVGDGMPCLLIAEAGVNHNGNLARARQLVEAARQGGADVIKFQTFAAERLVTSEAVKAKYQVEATGTSESQFEMLRRLELGVEEHRDLMEQCRAEGIAFLSTPFDEDSADLLEELEVEAFKIPSGEITNLAFVAHVARKMKPMIISTGMSTLGEVESAVKAVENAGNSRFILLHCTSAYPTQPHEVNLRAMETMARAFGKPVGYSDHTRGMEVALAAVALGACCIEKHLTVDRSLPGPDHKASINPGELTDFVASIRTVEVALGHGRKEPTAGELDTAAVARKSLVAACDIPAGVELTEEMVSVKRPGTGLPPSMAEFLIGRKARKKMPKGTLILMDCLT